MLSGFTLLSLWLAGASNLLLFTSLLFLLPAQYSFTDWTKNKLLRPYFNLYTVLESIKIDDYSFNLQPAFSQGISANVFNEITNLSQILRQKKRLFDKKELLVHSLIQQLDSPVLLLDDEQKLIHGNLALSNWLNKDWRLLRLMPAKMLGLSQVDKVWKFDDEAQHRQFKIRSSHNKNTSGEHQLLMLTDISAELRQMQSQSWQQMIRVLSHEIKNSLTPIKSLAQTLAEFNTDPMQKEALEVINERSHNLTEFVSRYSQLTQIYNINKQDIDISALLISISKLYPETEFSFNLECKSLLADQVLLEQVLINAITNANQAFQTKVNNPELLNLPLQAKTQIKINNYQTKEYSVIELIDNGCGVQNTNNLFVPFYTTKPNGEGIGLLLSRNIIEQHGGQLTLINNGKSNGATLYIKLPLKTHNNLSKRSGRQET